ncbi:ABC transporter substrate-binding protein [Thalassolituus sp. LLYu03]|uniref:ABC transporter substrate-binding protein n=1 Tax=Thalassolituus sp. LLYu03 TaxID=3421656 RepID=UPI003D2DC287
MVAWRMSRLLVACLVLWTGSSAWAGETLRVLNWGDYIDPDVIKEFEQKNNVTVEYVEYNSVDEFGTLFFNPKNQYDVIFPASRIVRRLAEANLIRPLDTSKLPDYRNLRSDIMAEYNQQDTGGVHGIPYMWGTTGMGVNKAEMQRLGIAEKEHTWALLFNSELRSKVASCGIALLNERDEIFAAALRYLGYSVNTQDEAQIDQAGELIKEALADVKYLHTTQYRDDLKAHKVCLVVGYSGDILGEIDGDEALTYVIPDEGAAMWIDIMSIPANSQHTEMAYRFVRFMMEAQIAARNSSYLAYPTAMQSALPYVDKDVLDTPVVYPSVAVLGKLEAMKPLERHTNTRMHRLWVKAMCSGRSWCSVPMKSFF